MKWLDGPRAAIGMGLVGLDAVVWHIGGFWVALGVTAAFLTFIGFIYADVYDGGD